MIVPSLVLNSQSSPCPQVNLDWFPLPVKKLKGTDPVETLDLSGKRLGVVSATVIAGLIGVNASLTKIGEGGLHLRLKVAPLDLSGNSMGEEGWAAIIGAVCSSTVSKIASIDASSKSIGPKGAKLIGEALRTSVNAELTTVWTPACTNFPTAVLSSLF